MHKNALRNSAVFRLALLHCVYVNYVEKLSPNLRTSGDSFFFRRHYGN